MSKEAENTPLSDRPVLQSLLVEAPLETVLSYFRGHCAHIAKEGIGIRYEVTGADAGIKQPFGPDHVDAPYDWLEERFPLRGRYRASVVASNPRFVLVEIYCNLNQPYFEEEMADWTEANVYKFYSHIGHNPMLDAPNPIHLQTVFPSNGFWSRVDKKVRYLGVEKNDGRWKVFEDGELAAFETPGHYKKRLISNRMNRSILFEYMSKLGLDPYGIFERRELKDAVLYTSDCKGRHPETFEAARLKFNAYHDNGSRHPKYIDDS